MSSDNFDYEMPSHADAKYKLSQQVDNFGTEDDNAPLANTDRARKLKKIKNYSLAALFVVMFAMVVFSTVDSVASLSVHGEAKKAKEGGVIGDTASSLMEKAAAFFAAKPRLFGCEQSHNLLRRVSRSTILRRARG
jgi:hypothetical protein